MASPLSRDEKIAAVRKVLVTDLNHRRWALKNEKDKGKRARQTNRMREVVVAIDLLDELAEEVGANDALP